MGFNLYLAGGGSTQLEPKLLDYGCQRLYSQVNDRRHAEKLLAYSRDVKHIDLFVDSGAFSVHTRGIEVDVDEYIQYVNSNQGMYEAIAQVDKIPGEYGKPKTLEQLAEAPELSWQNYLYMREHIIDVDCLLPIFHQGEDFKHLHRMLEWTDKNGKHIPYIGISPANDVSNRQKMNWFALVFHAIQKSSNPKVKTHAFGCTSFEALEKYPIYSADSTAWVIRAAYGTIFTPAGDVVLSDVRKDVPGHFDNLAPQAQEKVAQQLEGYGVTVDECRTDGKARALNNALYMTDWARNYKFKGVKSFQKKLF